MFSLSTITTLLLSALYGLVEGITEWLPISSTGHMLLLRQFLPLDVTTDFWDMFLVVIQLGAIIAVVVLFFHELNPFSPSKTADEKHGTWSLWAKIVVACLPAAVIGLPLDSWIEEHLGTPFVIAGALIVYGVIFIVLESARERKASQVAVAGAGTHRGGAHFASANPATETVSELADADAPPRPSRTSPGRPRSASASSRCSRSCPAPRAPARPSSAASSSAAPARLLPSSRSTWPSP